LRSKNKQAEVPLHEFAKHALLGEYAHYNQLSSLVACNVFDVSSPDPREHFLSSLVISHLSSPLGIKNNDGFVPATGTLAEMHRLGFNEDQVRHAVKRLAEKRLIETPHAHYREISVDQNVLPDQFSFRATSIGLYHVRFWIGAFSFLDATSTDTPIFDDAARGTVFENAASFEIKDRYTRTSAFKKYLERQWHDANFAVGYFDFPQVLALQMEGFQSVERFIERGPLRKNTNRKKSNFIRPSRS
jgi:hypothetical protein